MGDETVVFSVTAEQLAEDLEMFAHHAGRKSVNMNDVIISGMSMKLSKAFKFFFFFFSFNKTVHLMLD